LTLLPVTAGSAIVDVTDKISIEAAIRFLPCDTSDSPRERPELIWNIAWAAPCLCGTTSLREVWLIPNPITARENKTGGRNATARQHSLSFSRR
jgi:hypothetical protein